MLAIIVAYDEDRAIGKAGKVPWRLSDDMAHFKETTSGWPVIMGRKTWDSLPSKFKPLPDRLNIVVSRSLPKSESPEFCVTNTLLEAVALAAVLARLGECPKDAPCAYIIGGGQIYKEALDNRLVGKVIASEVVGRYDGDTFFPELDATWTRNVVKHCSGFDVVEYINPSIS